MKDDHVDDSDANDAVVV